MENIAIGKTFGRLTIQGIAPKPEHVKTNATYVYCTCTCNPDRIVIKNYTNIKYGLTRSCGCLGEENRNSRHVFNRYDLTHEYGIGWDKKGYEFYFSLQDYELIKEYTWSVNPSHGYVINCRNDMRMHRLILGANKEDEVDHINGLRHDNRRENLRIASHVENNANKPLQKNNTSGCTGVYYNKKKNKWDARIGYDNKTYCLGSFELKEDAIKARKIAESKLQGEYSYDASQELAEKNKIIYE